VKRTALLLLLAVLAGGACRTIQPEDDSDPAIKARVQLLLQGRKDLDIRYISVDVTNGDVEISGVVPAPEQVRTIDHILRLVPGVQSLLNNVVVQE
jgi:osmotically-inducible protein OsmY